MEGQRVTRSSKSEAELTLVPISVKIFKILVSELGKILVSELGNCPNLSR